MQRYVPKWPGNLKPDAAPYADIGFHPIPVDEIGLYQDAYRTGLPGVTGSVRKDSRD